MLVPAVAMALPKRSPPFTSVYWYCVAPDPWTVPYPVPDVVTPYPIGIEYELKEAVIEPANVVDELVRTYAGSGRMAMRYIVLLAVMPSPSTALASSSEICVSFSSATAMPL